MINKFDEIQEQFKKDCRVINLKYEYEGYIGIEKWAIITDLSESELTKKYADKIKSYEPFLLLSVAQGEPIAEFTRIEDKFRKRQIYYEDCYGYEDGYSERFHKELTTDVFLLPEEEKEIQLQEEQKEELLKKRLQLLGEALNTLTPIQRKRIEEHYFNGKSSRQIAKEEGVYYSAVDKSIALALKKLKKFF